MLQFGVDTHYHTFHGDWVISSDCDIAYPFSDITPLLSFWINCNNCHFKWKNKCVCAIGWNAEIL